MAVTYIGNNSPDGSSFGLDTTEKISFYGVTTVVQPTGSGQAAVATTTLTTASTTSSPAGYATTTQANDVATVAAACRTLVNQLRSDLVTLGLIKGSS